jgi:chemotaxis protein histidine kinase CheA
MNWKYYKPSPDNLTDWIEDNTKNPERFHRLVNILKRLSNWADGTYNDGIKVKRGEIRITINQLANKLGYSYDSTWNMLRRLQKAGWISIQNEYKLTIITLNWITHYNEESTGNNSQPDNRNSKNPITESKFSDNKPDSKSDNREPSATINNANKPDNKPDSKPDSKISDSRYQNQVQPDIRNKRSNKEIKEREIKEEKNIEADNKSADQKTENFEEKKEKLKEFREEVKKEIKESSESKEESSSKDEDEPVTDAHIRASVERIKEAFKTEYVKRFNKPAYISVNSINKIFKDFKESYKTRKRLKEAETLLIEKIPDFFSLTDEWVRKKGYSFFAFSWRIGDLLSEPVKPKYCGSYTNKEFSLTEAMPW